MPSRLSSLLVRDGLTSVRCIERAIQDQVISGGALDTVLLEMGAVPLPELLSYLSMATGLPVAAPTEHEEVDPAVADTCPHELADEHGAAPIALAGDALRVLVREDVNLESLESLASEIKLAIQPVVAPEWQYQLARARAYGGEVEGRYQKLAAAAEGVVGTALPAVADTERVEIQPEVTEAQAPPEERLRGKRPKPEQPERRTTMELSTDSLREHIEATTAMASTAPVIKPPTEAPAPIPETAESAEYNPADTGPLRPDVARVALASSGDRDATFQIFLRALRSRLGWTALFTVQAKSAIGRVALGDSGFDSTDIRAHTIPLDKPSPFKQVVDSQQFYIGAPAAGDDGVLETLREVCYGQLPTTLLLLPIVLRSRVVAIVAGHRFNQAFTLADISEMLPLANATADAVSRLIMQSKAAGYKSGVPEAQAAVVASEQVAAKDGADKGGAWSAPSGGDGVQSGDRTGRHTTAEPDDEEAAALLDRVQGEDAADSDAAMQAALGMRDRVLPVLAARFPGKLLVERNSSEETPRAATCGPLLDLVVRMGPATGELLAEKMRDNDKEVRYYATLCASEVRPAGVLNELVERVFDGDRPTRALAVEALRGYPRSELDDALDFARRALHSEDTERLRAAADALSKIADVRAIPDLLDAHSRGGDAAESARLALLALTKQDFGSSNRKWRNWWQKNAKKSRIEWMLDGLGHKSAEVRKSAADDLRTLTGEYFGYHHDLPKKERDQARQRWLGWWDETGQARFLSEAGGEATAGQARAERR